MSTNATASSFTNVVDPNIVGNAIDAVTGAISTMQDAKVRHSKKLKTSASDTSGRRVKKPSTQATREHVNDLLDSKITVRRGLKSAVKKLQNAKQTLEILQEELKEVELKAEIKAKADMSDAKVTLKNQKEEKMEDVATDAADAAASDATASDVATADVDTATDDIHAAAASDVATADADDSDDAAAAADTADTADTADAADVDVDDDADADADDSDDAAAAADADADDDED